MDDNHNTAEGIEASEAVMRNIDSFYSGTVTGVHPIPEGKGVTINLVTTKGHAASYQVAEGSELHKQALRAMADGRGIEGDDAEAAIRAYRDGKRKRFSRAVPVGKYKPYKASGPTPPRRPRSDNAYAHDEKMAMKKARGDRRYAHVQSMIAEGKYKPGPYKRKARYHIPFGPHMQVAKDQAKFQQMTASGVNPMAAMAVLSAAFRRHMARGR